MRAVFLLLLFLSPAIGSSCGQDCPRENPAGPSFDSASRTLSGTLVYHDGLRQWMGLKLSSPVCGLDEIQVLQSGGHAFEVDEGNSRTFEVLRGCEVSVEGPLGIGGTGYYSTSIYQEVTSIKAEATCTRKQPLPDYSRLKPDPRVRRYRVVVSFDYKPGDWPISAVITSSGRMLRPWQAYAHYFVTGLFVFYGNCADGFNLSHISGTPQANPGPGASDNQAMLDPESAAANHVTKMRLSFVCSR